MDEENDGLSLDELEEKFLKDSLASESEEDEPEPEEEADEAEPEEEADEAEPEEEAEAEEDPAKPAKVSKADDESDVTITVEGKEHNVKVKDLKRLFGQEAAITQRSQALALASRSVETQALFIEKLLADRTAAATAKLAKYSDVDLFKASRDLAPEEFDAIRAAQKDAQDELKVLNDENAAFRQNAQNHRQAILRERATNSLKEITKAIPEWNDELYTKVRVYAVSQGLDRDSVNEIVDPGAILMIHKAMKYDAASTKVETVTKKIIKSPTKVIKKSTESGDYASSKVKQVNRTAASSGDIDDIVDAYLANAKAK